MGFKLSLLFIIIFCLFYSLSSSHAQKVSGRQAPNADSARTAQKQYQDSVKAARQHIEDSTHTARQQYQDSVKTTREHGLDSMKTTRAHNMDSANTARKVVLDSTKAVRKHFADSLAAVHKYRDSKHYKDSVSHARMAKMNTLKKQRGAVMDSVKAVRKKTTDSVLAIRKERTDSIHTIQKRRSDSLAVIRKYRESKRFRDSVSVVRHERADSMQDARDAFNDKMKAIRKKHQDSVTAVRKHIMDSTVVVRTKHLDSVKAVRKVRTDSLAKVKVAREKAEAAKQKAREQKLQLALDVKIKAKHEKWSNESMLKKKWTNVRQVQQNTYSRFNYYYNGNLKMDEALANMQRERKENYDSIIGLYPFDPNRDSSLLKSDMDTIIRKASVGIQIHDPRIKWGDDLYLLMGEAYYYKGGYDNASVSFRYIISSDERNKKKPASGSAAHKAGAPSIVDEDKKKGIDFLKHRSVHNDAILWLSRTYTEAHQLENAESILALLDADPKLPDDLKGKIAIAKAFVELNDNNPKDAATQLSIGMKDNNVPSYVRQRAAFLNGQLLQQEGSYALAAESFKKVLDYYPKLEMDFYSRKYLAYNTLYAGGKEADAMAPLKKVLSDAKYATYYDQVYYVLGQLAVKANNNKDAVSYLQKSINTPKATKKQKAISFAALGNVYYSSENYVAAKRAYDSSAHYASAAPKDSLITVATARSRVLGKVTGPATTIHDQDSLLRLATLSDKEQREAVRDYLRELKQEQDDSIYRAENAGVLAVSAALPDGSGDNDYTNWYFSNPNQMQQGLSDFKHKWGNRALSDNWRRAAGAGFAAAGNNNNDNNSDTAADVALDENGLPTEASLLAAIPNTQDKQDKARKLIIHAYIELANAYVKDLQDYPVAINALDTLDRRYPNHTYQPDDLYLRYVVALRQMQVDKAKTYSSQLIEKYPNSEFAALVRPKEDKGLLADASRVPIGNYYDQTYNLLLQRQYNDVLGRIDEAKKQYKEATDYNDRFNIMEAMAQAGTGNYGRADTILTAFLHKNTSDSLRAWADAVSRYINKHRPASAAPAPLLNKMAAAQPPKPAAGNSNNLPPASPVTTPATYTYKPQEEHYCIISLPGIESRSMGVKAAITDFNTFKYSAQMLHIAMDPLSPTQATIVIKKFTNAAQAKSYMAALKATSQIFREYKASDYQVMIISAVNYTKLLSDRAIQPYTTFYTANYK